MRGLEIDLKWYGSYHRDAHQKDLQFMETAIPKPMGIPAIGWAALLNSRALKVEDAKGVRPRWCLEHL